MMNTTSIDQALAFRVYRLQRLLRIDLVRFLDQQAPGLTPEYYFLLSRLAEVDDVPQKSLVDPVIGDRPNISRHLANLETQGLVTRHPDPDDARSQRVHLTPDGRRAIEQLRPLIVQERQRIFGDVDPAELMAFGRVLDQLEATLAP